MERPTPAFVNAPLQGLVVPQPRFPSMFVASGGPLFVQTPILQTRRPEALKRAFLWTIHVQRLFGYRNPLEGPLACIRSRDGLFR